MRQHQLEIAAAKTEHRVRERAALMLFSQNIDEAGLGPVHVEPNHEAFLLQFSLQLLLERGGDGVMGARGGGRLNGGALGTFGHDWFCWGAMGSILDFQRGQPWTILSCLPVLDLELTDPQKLAFVFSDQREPQGTCMGRDEQIIRTDGCPSAL